MPKAQENEFGQQLREARLAAGLSIDDAASLLRISSRMWKYLEKGERVPPTEAEAITQDRLLRTMAKVQLIKARR